MEPEPCAWNPADIEEDELVQWAQCLLAGGKRKYQKGRLLGPILGFMHQFDKDAFETLQVVPEKTKEENNKRVRIHQTPEKYRVLLFKC